MAKKFYYTYKDSDRTLFNAIKDLEDVYTQIKKGDDLNVKNIKNTIKNLTSIIEEKSEKHEVEKESKEPNWVKRDALTSIREKKNA